MLEDMTFTRDDFAHSNWREIIAIADKRTCQRYTGLFLEAIQRSKESNNSTQCQIYQLLHAVCYLWLRPEERYQPFAPVFEGVDGFRSVGISDFKESHMTLLKEVINEIDDPELKARVGDVIWTFQHKDNFHFAEEAVDAYLQAGESLLFSEDYYYGIERFTRAIHLAASLGRNSRKFRDVIARIEILIDQNASANSLFVGQLLDLLYDYRQGDISKNASINDALAEHYQQRHEWYLARARWSAAASLHRIGENVESAQTCILREAECYIYESEDALKNSQGMRHSVAARHLQSAIEALRKVPGTETRQRELHLQMLELQANSRGELGRISQELDLIQAVEKAILAVQGKSFHESLFTFCIFCSPPRIQYLRERIEKTVEKSPLFYWIPMTIINSSGRVVSRRDSMLSGTPEEIEAAKIAEMHRWGLYEQVTLASIINNARIQILLEHNPDLHEFIELTSNNPFIPPGRELIFARGYLAGMQGDYLEALHLLIPQVENSLRYLLNRQGVVTSSLRSEGIQEEFDLNVLLEMPELNQILGEDLVFDLQGTLTSRFGSNFRNLMAHGLLDQQAFYSYSAIYIWWLLLRICCLPLITTQRQEENKDATTSSQ